MREDGDWLDYFAYGSNLHPARLGERCPSCVAVGTAVLPGHRLRFHKRSVDGSGKCDAFHTGRDDDRVIGVVYRIARGEKHRLDAAEGAGEGYFEVTLEVAMGAERRAAFLYRANPDYVDPTRRPYRWYRDFVLVGARHHRLPGDYVEGIEAVEPIADPDAHRALRHRRLLDGLP